MKIVQTGVAAIVLNNERVLLGKRLGSHGAGTWSFPGGKLDYGEDPFYCALRETKEETGMNVRMIDRNSCASTNDIFEKENLHFTTLYFRADYNGGIPIVMEPNKCEEWKWFSWNNLPKPLFLPVQNLIKNGYDPFK